MQTFLMRIYWLWRTLEAANIVVFYIEKVIIYHAKMDEILLPNVWFEIVGCHQFYSNSHQKTSLDWPVLRRPAVQKDDNVTNPKFR